jgi:hypothetical protein
VSEVIFFGSIIWYELEQSANRKIGRVPFPLPYKSDFWLLLPSFAGSTFLILKTGACFDVTPLPPKKTLVISDLERSSALSPKMTIDFFTD